MTCRCDKNFNKFEIVLSDQEVKTKTDRTYQEVTINTYPRVIGVNNEGFRYLIMFMRVAALVFLFLIWLRFRHSTSAAEVIRKTWTGHS